MPDFLLRALLAGVGVALVAGPLGAFVVWRRMAYFGDTLAHAAVLGIGLGLALGTSPDFSVALLCLGLALALAALERSRRLATDTLLGILAHLSLALGVIVIALQETVRVDLMGFLFGDILAVGNTDLVTIWSATAVASALLLVIWRPLLAVTVHEELARVEGVPVARVRLLFMLLMAGVVAMAMKVVGALLITSLLIVPAAAARRVSKSPEQMAILAGMLGCLSVAGGLFASLRWNTPAGPSIVVAAGSLFGCSLLLPARLVTR
jgi:zinc transport system permease protein